MRYANPFHAPRHAESKPEYENNRIVARSACGRGVIIEHIPKRGYHYLVNGLLVTERAGRVQDLIDRLCARILDGAEPEIYEQLAHTRFGDDRALAAYQRQISFAPKTAPSSRTAGGPYITQRRNHAQKTHVPHLRPKR